MAKIGGLLSPCLTVGAIDVALEEKHLKENKPRKYIGFSGIGRDCLRQIWLDYHRPATFKISAKGLRAIEDGHRTEDLMASRLRMVPGVILHTDWPTGSGNQIACSDFGGAFKGHLDGMIKGILEAPETWHVWEHKTVNQEKFDKLVALKRKLGEKDALQAWDATYYSQAILYMEYQNVTRHFLTVDTPGGRDSTSCRTNKNSRMAGMLRDKAKFLLELKTMPAKLNNPKMPPCAFCQYKEFCHG